MSTTACTISVAVMMLWLNHTHHVNPPPEWLRIITYQVFARVICFGHCCGTMRYKNRSKEDEEILERQVQERKERGVTPDEGEPLIAPSGLAATTLVEIATLASATAALEEDLKVGKPNRSPTHSPNTSPSPSRKALGDHPDLRDRKAKGTPERYPIADIKVKLQALDKKAKAVLSSLFEFAKKEEKAKNIDLVKEEWREIYKIINAFAFCVLTTFTVVFIIMCAALWIIRS